MAHEGQKVAGEYWVLQLSQDSVTWLQLICEKGSDFKMDRGEIDASSKCGTDKSPGIPTQSLSTDFYLIQGSNILSTEASYKQMFDWHVAKKDLYFKFQPVPSLVGIATVGSIVGGTAYTNGVYTGVQLVNGTNNTAVATVTVAGGSVTGIVITYHGAGYQVGQALTMVNGQLGGTGTGASASVATTGNYVQLGDLLLSGKGWVKNLNLTAKNQDRIQITSEIIVYPDDTVLAIG